MKSSFVTHSISDEHRSSPLFCLKIFLLQVNPVHNESLFLGILKCFASWIAIRAFDDSLLLGSPLLGHVLDILVLELTAMD